MIWNIIIFKWNTKFINNQHSFKNSYLFKNINKKNVMYLENYKHLL
jgi:hypothetical protein